MLIKRKGSHCCLLSRKLLINAGEGCSDRKINLCYFWWKVMDQKWKIGWKMQFIHIQGCPCSKKNLSAEGTFMLQNQKSWWERNTRFRNIPLWERIMQNRLWNSGKAFGTDTLDDEDNKNQCYFECYCSTLEEGRQPAEAIYKKMLWRRRWKLNCCWNREGSFKDQWWRQIREGGHQLCGQSSLENRTGQDRREDIFCFIHSFATNP